MAWLAQQLGVSASSARNATKLSLCIHVSQLYDTYRETRMNFVNWYLVCGVLEKQTPVFVTFSAETLFKLSEYVKFQKRRYAVLIRESPYATWR
jgi:hypothetical protein